MKTVQFNANSILNGNNYPIAYYYPMAKDLVVINTFIITDIYSC